MIHTIVLDIGNVLAHFGWKEYLQGCGYEEDLIQKIASATVQSKLWKEWDRGSREETELIELCCRQHPEIEKEIRAFFDHFLEVVKEYDYSEGFVRELKENGYKVYLLSNYSKWHFENDKKNFKFIRYVDGGIISHEINHVKPEAEIYEALINKYSINPKEAVFLDDIQENLDGAKLFGFHAILVTNIDQAKKELSELGVRI
ncbi:MAG TPA: HAD family phosphatase [Mobilitalea sp.]|nr:HAD family phosphatase [Mobilitalea sp.]